MTEKRLPGDWLLEKLAAQMMAPTGRPIGDVNMRSASEPASKSPSGAIAATTPPEPKRNRPMFEKLLEKFTKKAKAKARSVDDDRRLMGIQIAAGKEPDEKAFQRYLIATGKSIDETIAMIQEDGERVEARRQDQIVAATLPALRKQQAEAEAEVNARLEKLNAYVKSERAEIGVMGEKLLSITGKISHADTARERAIVGCDDPGVLEREKAHSEKQSRHWKECERLRKELETGEGKLRRARNDANRLNAKQAAEPLRLIPIYQKRVKQLEKELAAALKQREVFLDEQKEIAEMKLTA